MPTESEYYDEFTEFTGNYEQESFDTFMLIYMEAGAPDDMDTWFEFLNTFYPDTESHDKAYYDDLREAFYEYSGMTADNIDWGAWREWIEANSPGGS
jgi:hypothetical protein